MHRDPVDAGLHESGDELVRPLNHEMAIERDLGDRAKSAERIEGASSIIGISNSAASSSARRLDFSRLYLCHFFDQAAGYPIASEAPHGARIIFAFDDGQPRDVVIEHGGGCDKRRIFERYIYRIRGEKVS